MAAIIREDRVPYPNPINIVHNEETPYENGMLVGVKGFKAGERELYEVAAVEEGGQVAILTCSVLMYDERKDERDFTLEKGKAGKANLIQRGEVYTISKAFTGEVAVGDKLKPKATTHEFEKSLDGVGAIAIVRKLVTFEGQESAMIEML